MEKIHFQPIAILGAGSWGTALGLCLSRMGQTVRLWSYEKNDMLRMQTERMNSRYLPGFTFPDTLEPVVELKEAIANIQDILIAVPSHAFHEMLIQIKPLLSSANRVIWATKGLDAGSGQLLHEVALNVLGAHYPYAILSGPSFAKEVASGLPTAIVAASTHEKLIHDLIQRFSSPTFRVYSSVDMIGVEIGGIVKNVLAIATGISDGMQLGANARSALITRGLAEMIRFGTALGGQHETFIGLSGVGDLILTCTDDQSRNRRFGLALGQGKTAQDAERSIGQVVEGKRNAELIIQLAKKHRIEMPIVEGVGEILQGRLTPVVAMRQLFERKTKAEY